MDSLKIPKAGLSSSPTNSVGMKTSNSSGVPISVHFNAGEESVDDIFPSLNVNNGSPSNSNNTGANVIGVSTNNMGGSEIGTQPNASPSHQLQNSQANVDEQARNFLQGNFFNKSSGNGIIGGVGVGGTGGGGGGGCTGYITNNNQLSPNHHAACTLGNQIDISLVCGPAGSGHSPLSSTSPVGPLNSETDLTFNGSQTIVVVGSAGSNSGVVGGGGIGGAGSLGGLIGGNNMGCNSGCLSPNPSISPNKYQRSLSSYSNKSAHSSGCGSSPTPGYKLDIKAAQAAMQSLALGNGLSPTSVSHGGLSSLSSHSSHSAHSPHSSHSYLGHGGLSGNSSASINITSSSTSSEGAVFIPSGGNSNHYNNGLNMSPIEHCLNDIVRSMGPSSNCIGGDSAVNVAIAERLRSRKQMARENDLIVAQMAHEGSSPLHGLGQNNQNSGSDPAARFSRKVFVGGLPPDIDEDEITTSFRRFGALVVDWPHKAESKSYFPPKGYAFLLFQDENSVQQLIDSCIVDDDKLYLCVSSPTIKDKPVQIRPWRLADADYVLDATMSLDPRKTVFVGGVPRPLKAFELAMIMNRLYGGVCYAGIDTDPELKYPKGAGRVAFANQQSYIAAISARFVQLQHGEIDKRVEVKPYVLDDQMCDECEGQRCGGKFAPFFCANVTCLQYYCEHCWAVIHSRPGREYHKPLVKEGADRPRAVPFRWC